MSKLQRPIYGSTEDQLRKATIRLAYAKPELRPVLLPLLKQASMNKQAGYSLVNEMSKVMLTFMKGFAKDLKKAGYGVAIAPPTVVQAHLAKGKDVVFELVDEFPYVIKYYGSGRIRLRPGEFAADRLDLASKRALNILNTITV